MVIKKQMQQLKDQYLHDVEAATGLYSAEKKEILKERYNLINKLFEDEQVVSDTTVINYFEKLLALIKAANPRHDLSKVRLLISSTYIPNASSWGEGTVIYNAGLFNRLTNEAEVAFVLCHELSHYLLNHSDKQLDQYLSSVYSEEMQRRLQQLNKQEYNRGADLKALASTMSYGSKRHSRNHELEADSMAVILMQKTGFNLQSALACLSKLDSIDTDKYNLPLKLEERFSNETFYFRSAWIKKQTSLSVMASKIDKADSLQRDSLKTHPDVPLRVKTLDKLIQNKGGNDFLVNETKFHQFSSDFDFEIVDYCYRTKKLSRALYFSLEMIDSFPQNAWLHTIAGDCLFEMYDYQQKHHLSDVSDRPSNYYNESYNGLLRMINNVRLDDLAQILNAWVQNHNTQFDNDEGFLALQVKNASINNSAQKAALVSKYKQLYPNGKRLKELNK